MAYRVLCGVKAGIESLTNPIGFEWFQAQYESDEEAEAMHAMHVSRTNFARQQSELSSFIG